MPGPEGRGLSSHSRQLEPGDDHDRSEFRRRHLCRAARSADPREDHRKRTTRCRAADPRWPDRSQPGDGVAAGRRAREVWVRADRRRCRGHRDGRGPREVQGRHDRDRARVRPIRHRPHHGRGASCDRRGRPTCHHPACLHPRRPGNRHCRDDGGVRAHGGLRPRRQPHLGDPDRGVDQGLEGVRARGHA